MISLFFVIIYCVFPGINVSYTHPTFKIFREQDTADAIDFPYLVAIRYKDKLICTGSIIHLQWALTAANCFTENMFDSPWKLLLIAGSYINSNYFGQQYSIEKVLVHPDFNNKNKIHDIGLVKIRHHFIFLPFIQPIEIGIPDLNATLISPGWGGFRLPLSAYSEESPTLRFVFMKIINESDTLCGFNLYTICARRLKRQRLRTTWFSDTGGPLIDVDSNRLIGINSCASMNVNNATVEFFTRTDIYFAWIYSVVNEIHSSIFYL